MQNAFTLIELLVAVAMIAALLTLLTPALDRAIYQAELAACMAQLNGVVAGATVYANDYKQQYPHRRLALTSGQNSFRKIADPQFNVVAPGVRWDLRPLIRNYMRVASLSDPLSPEVDLDTKAHPNVRISSSYLLYFGVSYQNEQGMFKTTDSWTCQSRRFRLMASDNDLLSEDQTTASASHPDGDEVLAPGVLQDVADQEQNYNTASGWVTDGSTYKRGPLDTNHAYADGSVHRVNDIRWDDTKPEGEQRMHKLPVYFDQSNSSTRWHHAPK